ncbi:MAG TPA: 3-oxoacyl-ACP synthase, partial [Flavobacteriaceae bacterium]|nr:3-oxoacyl-ACP synthase [Flavobacteriaceae bacterium]
MSSVITGIGSYIPSQIKKNSDFINENFYTDKNEVINTSNEIIIKKFKAITGIEERRYAADNLDSSD